jgi:hypothetical protein
VRAKEAVMTEPRDAHRDRDTEATTADRNPEVKPELIKDLDVTGDDADVWGGCSFTRVTEAEGPPGQAR